MRNVVAAVGMQHEHIRRQIIAEIRASSNRTRRDQLLHVSGGPQ